MNTNAKSTFTILSHNINGGINNKIKTITKLASKYNVDVFCIQEAHVTEQKLFTKYWKPQKYFVYSNLLSPKAMRRHYIKNKKRKIKQDYKHNPVLANALIEKIDKRYFKPHGGLITLIHKRWCNKIKYHNDPNNRYSIITLESNLCFLNTKNIYIVFRG